MNAEVPLYGELEDTPASSVQPAEPVQDVKITGECVRFDLTHATYHADPVVGGSLSHSGAKMLLPPSCPARFQYDRVNGQPAKRVFDEGNAAHDRLLGGGPPIVVVDADSWRSKAAKAAAAEARAAGAVPILRAVDERVDAMAAAVRAHPIAGPLMSPDYGAAEASLFWRHAPSGLMLRSRFDLLPHEPGPDGVLIIPDYKTTDSAEPDAFAKSAARYGYDSQAAWYSAGALALGLAEQVAFLFVAQEKVPPYIVTVCQLDVVADRIGAAKMERAIAVYQQCTDAGVWPGYVDGIAHLSLPRWYEAQQEELMA